MSGKPGSFFESHPLVSTDDSEPDNLPVVRPSGETDRKPKGKGASAGIEVDQPAAPSIPEGMLVTRRRRGTAQAGFIRLSVDIPAAISNGIEELTSRDSTYRKDEIIEALAMHLTRKGIDLNKAASRVQGM